MSKAFNDFMDQYRSAMIGKFGDSCGVHTQGQIPSPSASVTSLSSDTGDRPLTGALGSGKSAPPAGINCAQEEESDGRLDALAGRVQAVNRVLDKYGICPEGADCLRWDRNGECRMYTCEQCGKRMCALCMEIHEMEPHVSDSMNAVNGKV